MKIFVFCISIALFGIPALAETYTWEDDQGTVNFTENLGNVPAKYRKKVKIVGEEEWPPPEQGEGAAPKVKGEQPGGGRETAPAAAQGKKKVEYGGKDAETWKSEFGVLNADVKAAEKQLVETRNRQKDTSAMSRSEYLNVQSTIKLLENTVLTRRKKLEDFRRDAERAGVPADLME